MKKKLKIIFLIINIFLFQGCKVISKNIQWQNIETIRKNKQELETGDILILSKKIGTYTWLGHSAIYLKEYDVVAEYPQIFHGFYYVKLNDWLNAVSDRKIKILRYKEINKKFKNKIFEVIENNKNKRYKVVLNKKNNNGFYCSQWVWYIFYKTGIEFNKNIDLDSDGGPIVYPYDFLYSNKLYKVHIGK
ncbi:permuted papain-like amidase YaeF/Yiix C92 family enzyme [Hypnocyclicus thermotrophus]|uniref:Permuted papain-like amidase YaeF/Yiix C92 family enzyme n=1 Tax=Hypnocyclicus thermotrophus TaxID=1627895 RepID=A0AA46DYX6_9FUSO|nr:YiiX/YebB-like N1pC/P60 family cysteine hydrolase [Hypnocyclicus thermotrophus]TDT71375.1 permuted papain-like amidase YaeF/Yiix C92 family enzyme [Hypnocyclicus thermotrophus]